MVLAYDLYNTIPFNNRQCCRTSAQRKYAASQPTSLVSFSIWCTGRATHFHNRKGCCGLKLNCLQCISFSLLLNVHIETSLRFSALFFLKEKIYTIRFVDNDTPQNQQGWKQYNRNKINEFNGWNMFFVCWKFNL